MMHVNNYYYYLLESIEIFYAESRLICIEGVYGAEKTIYFNIFKTRTENNYIFYNTGSYKT